jgi:hypothetical protein
MAPENQTNAADDATGGIEADAGTSPSAVADPVEPTPNPTMTPSSERASSPERAAVSETVSLSDSTALLQSGLGSTVAIDPPCAEASNGNADTVGEPLAAARGESGEDEDKKVVFGTPLLESALPALGIGAIAMIVCLRLRNEFPLEYRHLANEIAIGVGLLAVAAGIFLVPKLSRYSAAPDRANPWQYGELSARRDYLVASYHEHCGEGATIGKNGNINAVCHEARTHIQRIGEELRLIPCQAASAAGQNAQPESPDKWILGTGFVELWQRLHAAEAALYGQRPLAQQLAYASRDSERLSGSDMPNSSALKARLDLAIAKVQDSASDATARDVATQTMISIHRAIDDYRDQSRAGLARTRVHLIWAGLMTAVVAFILLALAIIDDVPSYQIVAGAAFFLVGAVTGLVWQLRNPGSQINSGEDDFGLDMSRLVYVPVLSGLAGVGGVLVMAMLYATLDVVPDPASAADPTRTIPAIADIFDLGRNRFGLLVAAIFGLTPDLLINRLQHEADRYQRQLATTSVQTRSDGSATVNEGTLAMIFVELQALRSERGLSGGVGGVNVWEGQQFVPTQIASNQQIVAGDFG